MIFRHEHGKLYRIIPYWPIDSRIIARLPVFNELYQKFLFSSIKKLLEEENISISHIVNFNYGAYTISSYFKEQTIVYYCNDDPLYVGRLKHFPIRSYIRYAERRAVREADCCIGTSDYLVKKLQSINRNSYRILLGAENRVADKYRIFNGTERGRRPIRVVFVGFMDGKTCDLRWIGQLMGKGEFSFTLVGPTRRTTRHGLNGDRGEIEFVGPRTGDALYEIISKADICIAPYNRDFLQHYGAVNGTTPKKLWLYLEFGKPVVLTQFALPKNLTLEKGLIYMVADNSGMADAIRAAYLEDNESFFKARIQIARNNSWESRIKALMGYLQLDYRVDNGGGCT